MHDPMTVAFEIRRPWRDKKGSVPGWNYYPPIVTVWHVDPEKDGSDDSCDWFGHRTGRKIHPRWHFWHWKIQVHCIFSLKRWLFTRCQGCGKRLPWSYSPVTNTWDGDGPRWFRGERDVWHHECHAKAQKADEYGPLGVSDWN